MHRTQNLQELLYDLQDNFLLELKVLLTFVDNVKAFEARGKVKDKDDTRFLLLNELETD